MKKPTIRDIAKELNVTFSSVARALNNHPAISVATKEAVLEVAKRLNYSPNKIASSLRSGKTNIIGVIVPNLHVNFFSSIVSEIEKVLNENNYHMLLYQSNDSATHENKGIEAFLKSRVDGIIASASASTIDPTAYTEIVNRNVPLVFFDRVITEIGAPSVTIDDFKGGYIATEHLIGQGYRHIVHITMDMNFAVYNNRYKGYIAALEANGLPFDEKLVFTGNFSAQRGKEVIMGLIDKNIRFDAIFSAEDITAMGAIKYLKSIGLRVPHDVGVMGFDNEPFGTLVEPSLSTVDQQSNRMGLEAANLLLKQFNNGYIPTLNNGIVLDPVLILRDSSKTVLREI